MPEDIQTEIDAVVAPRGREETASDFERRIHTTIRRKSQTAAAFTTPAPNRPEGVDNNQDRHEQVPGYAPTPSMVQHPSRFEGIGSISTAAPIRDVRFGALPDTRMPATSFAGLSQNISSIQSTPQDRGNVTVFDEFSDEMSKLIRKIIYRHLDRVFSLPPGVRPPKLDSPGKYSGQDDHGVYIIFLEKLCIWLKSQLMIGFERHALEWYTELMENPSVEQSEDQTFTAIMCAMHKRFVTSANAQKATRDFEAIRYDPETGPDGLMNNLRKYGQRMRERPSEFTIRSSFLRNVPDDMHDTLIKDRGFTPEYSDAAALLDHARQLWVASKLTRSRRRVVAVPIGACYWPVFSFFLWMRRTGLSRASKITYGTGSLLTPGVRRKNTVTIKTNRTGGQLAKEWRSYNDQLSFSQREDLLGVLDSNIGSFDGWHDMDSDEEDALNQFPPGEEGMLQSHAGQDTTFHNVMAGKVVDAARQMPAVIRTAVLRQRERSVAFFFEFTQRLALLWPQVHVVYRENPSKGMVLKTTATSTELCGIPGGLIRQGMTSVVSTICQFSSSPFPLLQKDEFAQEGALGSSVVNGGSYNASEKQERMKMTWCYIPSQKGKERPPGSPDVDASPEHPEEDRRFSCRLFSQHHSSEGYRKGCRVIRQMLEATGGKLVEADRLRWSPTQCNRLCGSSTRPGWDPSDRKRSGRRAWEPGLICDSAGDSEDARKGTGEAPDEVEGSRPETGKGLSQEPDDWSEE
ncbi:hypothetical protein B0H11DRAFT_2209917 [Mycena galericulata]|nr:hypothetical protein B0H11DRAFT_2209917 [Mycena galericulata]